jgi:hypothetical protein
MPSESAFPMPDGSALTLPLDGDEDAEEALAAYLRSRDCGPFLD